MIVLCITSIPVAIHDIYTKLTAKHVLHHEVRTAHGCLATEEIVYTQMIEHSI